MNKCCSLIKLIDYACYWALVLTSVLVCSYGKLGTRNIQSENKVHSYFHMCGNCALYKFLEGQTMHTNNGHRSQLCHQFLAEFLLDHRKR